MKWSSKSPARGGFSALTTARPRVMRVTREIAAGPSPAGRSLWCNRRASWVRFTLPLRLFHSWAHRLPSPQITQYEAVRPHMSIRLGQVAYWVLVQIGARGAAMSEESVQGCGVG